MIEENLPNISSAKFISGIDKLYYGILVDFDNYSTFYNNILIKGYLKELVLGFKRTSPSDDVPKVYYQFYTKELFGPDEDEGFGPTSHDVLLCTFTFKNLNQKDNNYFLKVDVASESILLYGLSKSIDKIHDIIINQLGIQIKSTIVLGLDPNFYLMGEDLSFINESVFSTRTKKANLRRDNDIQDKTEQANYIVNRHGTKTFYLGTRKYQCLRLYNKSKELIEEQLYTKSTFLHSQFIQKYNTVNLPFGKIWQIEFELGRDVLKTYGVTTIEDAMERSNFIFRDMCKNKFRLLVSEKRQKNNDRIKTHWIWDFIMENYQFEERELKEFDKMKIKKKNHDSKWLMNRIDEFIKENPEKVSILEVYKYLEKYL